MNTKYVLTTARYTFDICSDALSAALHYEASHTDERAYEIEPDGDQFVVKVYAIGPREMLGYVAPAPALASQFAEEST